MSVSWSLELRLAPAPYSRPWLLVADAVVAESCFAEDSRAPKTRRRAKTRRLSYRLLRIRARGPQRSSVRQDLSFCAALRCDSIKNAAALQ